MTSRNSALDTEAFRLVERNKELEAENERLRKRLTDHGISYGYTPAPQRKRLSTIG